MKKLAFLLFGLIITIQTTAQSDEPCETCLPEGIEFTTQSQIDSFQINYPNCTKIMGDVIIGYWDCTTNINIVSLQGLNVVTSIYGKLKIYNTDSLKSLTGLNKLTSVGGNVDLGASSMDAGPGFITCMGNSSLISLTGLDNLTYVGGNFNIYCNEKLTDFTGLFNLTTIEGDLNIGHAHVVWGGSAVTSAGNQLIIALSGMESISYIGNDLKIEGNSSLTTISDLNSEVFIGGDISIKNNETLSTCEAQSICKYLLVSNDSIDIHDNAPGCNSPEEVMDSCEANAGNIDWQYLKEYLNLYPNPANHEVNISAEGFYVSEVIIYTLTGQQVFTTRPENNKIDISYLPPGMYIVEVRVEGGKVRRKLLVK